MGETQNYERTFGIKLIAVVNGIAAVLHLIFWIVAFIRLSSFSPQNVVAEKLNLATTYGFGIADIIWSVPLLAIGSIGLWKLKQVGWLAANLANVLYWYSLTVVLTRDLSSSSIAPGTILFFPFALFSFWVAYYLWKVRSTFLNNKSH
jgi:hypothetical protein